MNCHGFVVTVVLVSLPALSSHSVSQFLGTTYTIELALRI